MTDFDFNNIYVDSNPWDELLKNNTKEREKLLSSTNSLNNISSSKSKISLKSSIKLNKDNEQNDNRVITISEIVSLQFEELKVLKILEYQYVITKHLKNNLKNLNEHKEDLIKKLLWLLESTKYLQNKFGLSIIETNKSIDLDVIPRSSYKFCKYNYKCKYVYKDKSITESCYEQHIVYNYLYNDINFLHEYISNRQDNYDLNEIQKCINTVYFVINHIKEELENIKSINNCNLDTLKCIINI
jgi:hypothetical protein